MIVISAGVEHLRCEPSKSVSFSQTVTSEGGEKRQFQTRIERIKTMADFCEMTVELGDKIAALTLKQAKELADYLEEVHGIKAAAGGAVVMAAAPAGGAEAAAAEQTEFTVQMDSFGDKKIEVIKVIRALTGLGLKEARDLVESAPCKVKEGIAKDEAEKIKADLEAAGAAVTIK